MNNPKGLKNLDRTCFLNVGFQSLASLSSLQKLYAVEYQSSILKEALKEVLYGTETTDPSDFVLAWNNEIRRLVNEISLRDEEDQGKEENDAEKEKLRDLIVHVDKPGHPLLLLEDIFPRIWSRENYPWFVNRITLDDSDNNLTTHFSKLLHKDIENDDVDEELFKKVMVVMLEGEVSDIKAAQGETAKFSKQLIIKYSATEAGVKLKYQLISVIEHLDSEEGHYVAYVRRTTTRNAEKWYKMDDDIVTSIPYQVVKKIKKPEILIYELVDK